MKKYLLLIIIFFSIGFNQTYDPETGEIIEDKKVSQIQFDPLTGERISNVPVQSTFQKSYNVRQLGYRDAIDNFNTGVTWSVLGGGISLFSIPPLAAFGVLLGGDDFGFIGFLGGISLATMGVPRLLAKNESQPSKLVLQQDKIQYLSKKEKQEYINRYSKEIEKKRMEAIRKGQIGWAMGGIGTLFLTILMFDGF